MGPRATIARLRGRPAWQADLGLALLLAALVQLELALADPASIQASPALNVAAGLLATLPLALRGRYPATVVVGIVLVLLAQEALGGDVTENAISGVLALVPATYSLGRHSEGRRTFAVAAVAILFFWTALIASGDFVVADFVITALLLVVAPVLAGRAIRTRQAQSQTLQRLNVQLEREQETRAASAVSDERARIARELHDVVAHSVSVMVVQAQAAQRVIDSDAGQARGALRTIEETGRGALVEMRRLLGVLRKHEESEGLAPQPGLGSLDRLVARSRQAGLPVEVSIEGEPRSLTPGVDLSAYRIIQEALTNALKHAGPARATVRVGYGTDQLEIEVADDGRGSATQTNGVGHGLVGMRQRVELHRGRLETGPVESGGYRVRAWLPLDDLGQS